MMEPASLIDSLYPRQPASAPRTSSPAEFAAMYGPAAERAGNALGVDPRVILGQWGLETGWGKSVVPGTNNLGNIKDFAGGGVPATDTGSRDRYRAYASPEAFADDFVSLIQRKYPGAVGAGGDPSKFTAGLAGYAEDPRYADKVAQAARMAGAAPGALTSAVGRAVGALVPSAHASEPRPSLRKASSMGQSQVDSAAPEWDALAQRFGQVAAKQETGADPWADLNAQFSQPKADANAPRAAGKAAGVRTAPSASADGQERPGLLRGLPFGLGLAVNAIQGGFMKGEAAKAATGAASGMADVGDTLINAGVKATGLGQDWNADRQASLDAFNRSNAGPAFSTGRVAGNIGATFPVGSVLAAPFRAAAPLLGPAAPFTSGLAQSLASGGFRTGLAPSGIVGQVGNMGTRIAGGAITGGASAGLVSPDSAATGAAIGAGLPPALGALGKTGDLLATGVRAVRTPELARSAKSILDVGGYKTAQEIAAVRAALTQQGPNIVQAVPTTPQVLQNPGISQLARTLRNSGETRLLAQNEAQESARMAALNRLSPVTGTVQQSAENFGNALGPQVRAADELARRRTSAAFDAVDPFDESRILLPIERMQAAQQTYLGPGTFGTGARAQQAVQTARNIGEETLGAVTPMAAGGARRAEQTLEQAVRRAGGINAGSVSGRQLAGELRDLRQSGAGRLVFTNQGQPLDRLAQQMHAAGFIDDADPATLLNALRDSSTARSAGAAGDADRAFRALRESAQGDAPGALTMPRPVPFSQVQNLRSSISEAAADAAGRGANKEAAALRQMVADIDEKVGQVAGGRREAGEIFPADMVDQWRAALAVHTDRMQRYRTGPQASIFRQGGDGLPAAQGAELAPKFFSPRLSQADDIAAFDRVATPETTSLLKNYAVTDAASQTNRLGALTNAKFNNWLAARSGAVGGLFDDAERATLSGVGNDLARADATESLGRAVGSNTSQNVQSALGIGVLDSPLVKGIAGRTPVIGKFTGPMLDSLRETAKRGKVERLSGLLADPEALDRALAAYFARNRPGPSTLSLANREAAPALYRAGPLLLSDR